MILSGKLGPFSVPEVLQFLSLTRSSGLLVIDTGADRAWVYFNDGQLIYARRRGPTERLGDRLLRLGYISESQLVGANLRVGLSRQKKRIGQVFLDAGSLDEATLRKVVQGQIREVVAEVIGFQAGEFQFFQDRLPAGEDILLDVNLDLLLLEGCQKLDELGRPEAPPPPAEPV